MADYHSRPHTDSSQRIHASQLYHWQEEMGLAQDIEDVEWKQRSSLSKQSFGKGLKLQGSRSPISSEASSNGPDLGHPGPADLVSPDLIASIPPWKPSKMDSDSSLETYHTTFELQSGGFEGPIRSGEMSVSAAEARAPSPRSQMNVFKTDHQIRPTTFHIGPLDRYLAQEDDLTDLGDNPKRMEEEWRQLRFLRSNVMRLRNQLRIKRKELQEKQLAKDHADAAFMKFVRENRFGKVNGSSSTGRETLQYPDQILDDLYGAMQAARDDYGPSEYDYNILEDHLDEEQFNLARVEGRLYNTKVEDFPFPEPDLSTLDDVHSSTSPESLLGLLQDDGEEYHSLYARYLSKLGDLDLAKEKHMNMIQERESILSSHESREHLGIVMNEEDQDFLDYFPEQEAALQGEIAHIEEDVERCRKECVENGIELHESTAGSLYQSEKASSDVGVPERNIDLQESSINAPQKSTFPVLLPGPDEDEERGKLGFLITDFDEGNKSDRINRWILYQLRTSPLEVHLLFRLSDRLLELFDLRHWQLCVLDWWPRDDANKPPEVFKGARTPNSTKYTSIVLQGRNSLKHSKSANRHKTSPDIPHRRTQSLPTTSNLDMRPQDQPKHAT